MNRMRGVRAALRRAKVARILNGDGDGGEVDGVIDYRAIVGIECERNSNNPWGSDATELGD